MKKIIVIAFILASGMCLLSCKKSGSRACITCTVSSCFGHPEFDTVICNPDYVIGDALHDRYGNMCVPKQCK